MPVLCSPLRVGGSGGTGWWCLRLQLCLPALPGLLGCAQHFWKQNELMTIPLSPSEDEGGVSLVSDIPSSKQSAGLDQHNVFKGHFCCLLGKKKADCSVSDGYTGKFLKLVIAVINSLLTGDYFSGFLKIFSPLLTSAKS